MRPVLLIVIVLMVFGVHAIRAQDSATLGVEAFLSRFAAVVSGIADYQCRIADWSMLDGEEESRIVNFYFQRPRSMRMDIIIGTRFGDDGSRAVYLPSGKVEAKMRRIPFPRVLDLDHSLVTTIRGKSLLDTDLIGIQRVLETYLATGSVTLRNDGRSTFFEVEHGDTADSGGLDREVIRFDARSLLPMSADGFESGALVQHFVFSDYVLNVGLPHELFNVRYDSERLVSEGIPTVVSIAVRDVDLEESRFPAD
jgi:outer membrane lipoprotein-sorting protein